jgi:two-component system chemotaxis sensor kinase CheA
VALILDLIGISEMMELSKVDMKDVDVKEEAAEEEAAESEKQDKQTLLIVHNGPNEPFAVPLGLVARIEKIKSSEIQVNGGRRAIKYRDGILPLFALEEAANVSPRQEGETLVVVVFKVAGREVGLMLSEVVDIVETDAKVDDVTYKQTGIFGSGVINGRITLIIDLYGLVYYLMPHWLSEHREQETVVQEKDDGRKPVILIAEDSKFFMNQLKGFMEDSGYSVLTAEDGDLAWKELLAHPGEVDIVLTDIEMPNADGLELCQRIRADGKMKDMPVIAVTSIAGAAAEQKGFQSGLDEYLIKLDRDEIIEKCNHYLKNGRKRS